MYFEICLVIIFAPSGQGLGQDLPTSLSNRCCRGRHNLFPLKINLFTCSHSYDQLAQYVKNRAGLTSTSVDWGYNDSGETGPDNWEENYPQCKGSSQSPINILSENTKEDENLGQFKRDMFGKIPEKMTLSNNGHTLLMNLHGGYSIDDDSLLPGVYKLDQFHFHWGVPEAKGSEHTLDGSGYFGEMHLVHYNTKYKDLAEAKTKTDGLAVIAVFIDISYPQDNLNFQRILNAIKDQNVTHKDSQRELASSDFFSVETLLPCDLSVYYRYMGSLTTPGCDETVLWTVFNQPLLISKKQASFLAESVFKVQQDEDDEVLANNFRPTQPLNGRVVSRPSSGESMRLKTTILIFCTIIYTILH